MGSQVKGMRLAMGLSAAALAEGAGISRSMLSRIESGLVSPSIEVLDHIAAALHVPLSRFFGDQNERADCSYVPDGGGLVVDRDGAVQGYRYELLGHVLSGNAFVEPYLVTLGAEAEPYVTFQHAGMKFLRMVSGRVRYTYGSRSMELRPGDSLLFEAHALHGISEILERPVSYLVVVFTLRD
ncbi:helix-turn-helix domain-containing protein [Variovorax sp. VNK109]|uniref:helix-turn-helix domain-containing protein n=1 Tax=Variovorax sp. VNK109 TaxID=3400919 RepID=UPI003C10FF6A